MLRGPEEDVETLPSPTSISSSGTWNVLGRVKALDVTRRDTHPVDKLNFNMLADVPAVERELKLAVHIK